MSLIHMTLDDRLLLHAQTRALAHWRVLHAAACAAETELLRAELRHARGAGPRPASEQQERARALRAAANAWREATPVDFRGPARPQEMMYAPAALESSRPSAPRNSMRVLATRDPRRSTSACNSNASPIAGRR